MVSNFPTSIVVHGMALNITVQSYDQHMDFGLMADAAAMPDVRTLADALRVAFDDLCVLDDEINAPPTLADTGRAVAGRAGKRIQGGISSVGGKVGSLVGGMVGSMVKRAVQGAVSGAVTPAAKPASAARKLALKPAAQPPTRRARTIKA